MVEVIRAYLKPENKPVKRSSLSCIVSGNRTLEYSKPIIKQTSIVVNVVLGDLIANAFEF